ncbi:MAG: hypothetical protein DRH20_01570 [Deltaproteobacteria bacterium]|nr:MAG: hypothetical protein DRH20_01570 [Deltaproteobacteria bacterium]
MKWHTAECGKAPERFCEYNIIENLIRSEVRSSDTQMRRLVNGKMPVRGPGPGERDASPLDMEGMGR